MIDARAGGRQCTSKKASGKTSRSRKEGDELNELDVSEL